MLQDSKITVKYVTKHNYFAMGDAETHKENMFLLQTNGMAMSSPLDIDLLGIFMVQ